MKYFKNVELAKLYKVSERTIGNWIDSAHEKKIDLKLINENDRWFVLNTATNHLIMKNLSEKGKKFKNTLSRKIISPKKEFYELFNSDHIVEIITNIETYKEIPHQFAYFDKGAEFWDEYSNKLYEDKNPNSFKNNIELLRLNKEYIKFLVREGKKVNVIDIGPGNGLPMKDFLQELIKEDLLRKYIAIDYSHDMLDLAKANLREWFGDKFPYEGHIRNMNSDLFKELLYENSLHAVNLVMLFGGTASNQREMDQVFHTIRESMTINDYFLYAMKLDSDKARRYFDFNSKESNLDIIEKERIVLDCLNITPDLYSVLQYYDADTNSRVIQVELKVDIEIHINVFDEKTKVSLNSKDKILLWRSKHQKYFDVMRLFERLGFEILHTSRSIDKEQLLVISQNRI